MPQMNTMNYLRDELYELMKKEEFIFSFTQEFAHDGLWFCDLENPENEWMNPKFWITLGYDPKEMPHKSSAWKEIIHPDDLKTVNEIFKKHQENPKFSYDTIVRYTHKDGSTVWMQRKGLALKDKTGKANRMLGAHILVPKQKIVETQLRERIQRYEYIINGTNIATWEWNVKTGETIYNERWAEILGYTLKELEPISIETWMKFVHPDDLKTSIKLLEDHFDNKTPFYENETRLRHKDGQWVWVLDKGKVFSWTDNGKPLWMMGSHQDITERKNNELLLLKYKDLLERTKESPSTGTWEINLVNNVIHWSKRTKEIYEVDDSFSPSYESVFNFFPQGENRNKIMEAINKATTKGSSYDLELQIVTHKNKTKWVRAIGIPEFLEKKCVLIYGLFQDIDEKKKARLEIAFKEEQFQKTFKYAANGMALMGVKGEWLDVNNSLCEMLGYSEEELLKLTSQDITNPEDLHTDLSLLQELVEGKRESYQLEKRFTHKNGQIVWVMVSTSMVKDDQGNPIHFVSQINDITQKKWTALQLQVTINKLQGIQDASTQVAIIETDKRGIIKTFNKGAENLLGYTADELVRKQTPEIIHVQEEVEQRAAELSQEFNEEISGIEVFVTYAKKGLFETREWTYIRKDLSRFPVQLTVTSIKNHENDIKGFLYVATDITLLKASENEVKALLEVTQEQNKRLLNFAHIVSHNLRSHSGNFSMLIDLMKEEVPEATDNEFFPLLSVASDNLKETITHLNEVVLMNTKTNENLIPLNLNEFVEKAILNVKALAIASKLVIHNTVNPKITINYVAAYLESIILNFLTNAIKYKSPDRDPVIRISTEISKPFVVLNIEDNGIGIDLELHGSKLFGMYKTFHGNKDARGIGLFITKNQVESLGGKIEVESELDKGTTFKIYLPYLED